MLLDEQPDAQHPADQSGNFEPVFDQKYHTGTATVGPGESAVPVFRAQPKDGLLSKRFPAPVSENAH